MSRKLVGEEEGRDEDVAGAPTSSSVMAGLLVMADLSHA